MTGRKINIRKEQGPLQVKICGLRRMADVEMVNKYHPNLVGFIFVRNRGRYVDPHFAETLRKNLDPTIKSVGVFVDAGIDEIAEVIDICQVDAIQLHGHESDRMIRALKMEFPDKTIIKAFHIETEADVQAAEESAADLVLLDHGIGGTGEKFDWDLILGMKRRFYLAGGINAANLPKAVELTNPYGVDVSSSMETEGFKDEAKIGELMGVVQKIRQDNY